MIVPPIVPTPPENETPPRMTAEVTVDGNCGYRCGAHLQGTLPQWGLEGTYRITAVRHVWEKGLFTTELTLEGTE